MGVFVPKKIEVELSPSTISLVKYVVDKFELVFRNSIFWRGQ